VKREEGNTNSPELWLLKFLLLTYYHSHFLAATLDLTSFFTMAFLGAAHFFYSWAVFGLDVLFTSYCPDIVIFNSQLLSITLLELTCPLDSTQRIQAAQNRKQNKVEYLQLLAEFDCLNIPNCYETIEITVLCHYQLPTIKNLLNLLKFVHPEVSSYIKVFHQEMFR